MFSKTCFERTDAADAMKLSKKASYFAFCSYICIIVALGFGLVESAGSSLAVLRPPRAGVNIDTLMVALPGVRCVL